MTIRTISRIALAAVLATTIAAATAQAATAHKFKNCTDMHRVYPHGVGRPGAHNKGGSLTGHWFVSKALYTANAGSDRDKDGIACER